MPVTIDDIRAARDRIKGHVYRSPCAYSYGLSRLCGADVWCKRDHLQATGSFKERGARNKLSQLDAGARARGVIAASAGNHALALAYHGHALGIPVTVVMPLWAPLVKVSNCRGLSAEVMLHGESFDEAFTRATALGKERGMTYVPGFDDDDIIAGAGTAGLEILEDVPDCDAVVVPVGGGGLIVGIGCAIKALRPATEIIGAEAANAPTLHASLARGELVKIPTKPTLADGLAIAAVGVRCFALAKTVVDRVVLLDEPAIATAILHLIEHEKTVVEGAGAVSLAAVMDPAIGLKGKKVVLVLSGGNIDLTTIAHVIERGMAATGRLCRVACSVSDRPGSLAKLLALIAATGASIKDVIHDRSFGPTDVAKVLITCVVETRDRAHIAEIRAALTKAGVEFTSQPAE